MVRLNWRGKIAKKTRNKHINTLTVSNVITLNWDSSQKRASKFWCIASQSHLHARNLRLRMDQTEKGVQKPTLMNLIDSLSVASKFIDRKHFICVISVFRSNWSLVKSKTSRGRAGRLCHSNKFKQTNWTAADEYVFVRGNSKSDNQFFTRKKQSPEALMTP